MFLVLGLLLFSVIRQRRLLWFYGASAVMALVFSGFQYGLPRLLELLASYRSDWSLLFLNQNVSFVTLLTQGVFLVLWYALIGLVLFLTLELWSLVSFRWQRLRIIFDRVLRQSWYVVFFGLMTLIMNVFTGILVDGLSQAQLLSVLQLGTLLFSLQFFVRLCDNAYLHTPKLLMEYLYATGLMVLLSHFVTDWLWAFEQEQFFLKSLFLQQMLSFFLVLLLLGILGTFFVRALFASAFFLQHYHRQTTVMRVWTSRILLSQKDRDYRGQRMMMGMGLSLLVGFIFVELILMELYLVFVPLFFLAYFLLFVLLDRQDDMRLRGDIVDKRIESEVSQVFFS